MCAVRIVGNPAEKRESHLTAKWFVGSAPRGASANGPGLRQSWRLSTLVFLACGLVMVACGIKAPPRPPAPGTLWHTDVSDTPVRNSDGGCCGTSDNEAQ